MTLYERIHLTELFAVLFLSYHFSFRFLLIAYLTFKKLCHDLTGVMFLRLIVQFSVFFFAFVEAPTSSMWQMCIFYWSLYPCNGAAGGCRSKSADILWIFLKLSGAESLDKHLFSL